MDKEHDNAILVDEEINNAVSVLQTSVDNKTKDILSMPLITSTHETNTAITLDVETNKYKRLRKTKIDEVRDSYKQIDDNHNSDSNKTYGLDIIYR
jgi:hypothetical protein